MLFQVCNGTQDSAVNGWMSEIIITNVTHINDTFDEVQDTVTSSATSEVSDTLRDQQYSRIRDQQCLVSETGASVYHSQMAPMATGQNISNQESPQAENAIISAELQQSLKMKTDNSIKKDTDCVSPSSAPSLPKTKTKTADGYQLRGRKARRKKVGRPAKHTTKIIKDKIRRCSYCSYETNSSACLLVHERRHTGEKPYSCPECNYAGTQASNTVRHIKTAHPDSNVRIILTHRRITRTNV